MGGSRRTDPRPRGPETVPEVAEGPARPNLPAQPFHDGLTGLWTQEACFALGEQTLATGLGRAAMVLSVDLGSTT